MGKTLKSAVIGGLIFAAFAGLVIVTGGFGLGVVTPFAGTFGLTAASSTLSLIGAAALGGAIVTGLASLLAPKADLSSTLGRARVTVNPDAPMTWLFGETALSTDVVWAGQHGDQQQFFSLVIAGAGHLIDSFGDLYINDELIAFSGDAATGDWAGGLWRQTAIGTEAQAAFVDIDAADNFSPTPWATTAQGRGMAHYRLRFETSHEKVSGGVPTRITQVAKCGPVYDPRLDGTRGGVGTHRTDDQTTWEYNDGTTDIGRNWALITLRYLLGWKINGVLVIGMGIDGDDIDIDQAVAAANVCEVIQDGIERYRIGGILPVSNDHAAIVGQLESAINGKIAVVGGKYYIWAPNNDLTPFSDILEVDLLREAGVHFLPSGPMEQLFNTARGRYVDTTAEGLFQLKPYPEVVEPTAVTEDGGTRLIDLDFPYIQDVEIAERVARQYVRRSRFGGTWAIALGPKGLTFQPFSVTTLNIKETNNGNETVRVTNESFSVTGVAVLELIEEDPSIYDTTLPLGTPVTSTPVGDFDTAGKIPVTGLAAEIIDVGGITGMVLDAFKVTWDDPGSFVLNTHVQFKIATSPTWTNETAIRPPAPEAFIFPLVPNTSYDIRARHISQQGVAGDFVSIVKTSGIFTVLGGDTIFNSELWVAPIADPMGGWILHDGTLARSTMLSSIVGPFIHLPKTIRIQGDGTAPGFYSAWKHFFKVNDSGSYIVYCWVRRRNAASTKGMHMGFVGTVQDLITPFNDNSNAFSLQDEGSLMVIGTWYLGVSILHPSDYVGADVGIAGLYDPADGTKIIDGNEFRVKAGTPSYDFRFGFFSNTTSFVAADGFEFTRPVGYRLDGTEPSIQTALDLAGVTGKSLVVTSAFLRKATAPNEPVADTGDQYDFATHILTPPSTAGGSDDDWFASPPAADGNPLYVIQATAEIFGSTGVDQTLDWNAPQVLLTDGSDGGDGNSIFVASVFLRKATAPTKPVDDDGQYNFTTNTLTPPGNPPSADDWSITVPTGTDPLYVSSGSFEISGSVGIDPTVIWSTPTILASDGADGAQGSPGDPGNDGDPGVDSIVSQLTNPVFVTPADNDGTNYSLTGSGGTHKVFEGVVDKTTASTHSVVGGSGSPSTLTQNGLTMSVVVATGVYSLSGASWTSDSESFTLRAVFGGVTNDKVYTISKSKAGGAGSPGQPVQIVGSSVIDISVTPDDARGEYGVYSNGKEQKKEGFGGFFVIGDWLISGALADYEVDANQVSGDAVSGSALDTWLVLSTSREWHLEDTSSAGPALEAELTIRIRNKITLTVIDTATVTFFVHEGFG